MSAVVESRPSEIRPAPPKAPPGLATRRLQEMPAIRQLIQIVMLAAALALGLWFFFWTQQPGYASLYSGLADRDAAEISEALRAANIPFKLEAAGSAIAVPENQLSEARLKMAALGLPQGSRSGFEMIEGEQGFGVSQFVEGARYQMALETELARTIVTLRPVRNARVHLAMPKPSAFTRQRDESAASVVLELFPGRSLDGNQTKAIVHLVATSIPNLAPERVTVIDQSGRLLTQPDPNSEDAINDRQFEQVQRVQNDYAARIARLLEPMTGAGRVSAQVSVDMDFSMVEEARELFGAEPQKVRSEQVSEESMTGNADGGVPGAVPNTPPTGEPTQAGAPGTALPSSAMRSQTRNYEMDRTLVHSRQQPGRITRVSAAVLVDNIPRGVDAEGNAVTTPLEPEELARIEALVREAIGFNAERGDSVSVVNAGFTRPEPIAELEPQPFWENPGILQWARLGAGALAVLLVLMMVVRPALRQVLEPAPALSNRRAADEDDEELDEEEAEARAAARLENQRRALAEEAGPRKMSAEEEAHGILAGPENYEQRLTVAKAAVQQDPRRVAQVVRGWVNASE